MAPLHLMRHSYCGMVWRHSICFVFVIGEINSRIFTKRIGVGLEDGTPLVLGVLLAIDQWV